MSDFRKLEVWQKAHELVIAINEMTDEMRAVRFSSLRSQTIRAAMSIDANIAEGRGQRSDEKFVQFLNIAVNSANELEAHLLMARDLTAISQYDYVNLRGRVVQVRKMLHGLINRISGIQRRSE